MARLFEGSRRGRGEKTSICDQRQAQHLHPLMITANTFTWMTAKEVSVSSKYKINPTYRPSVTC
jgi:hypothetical protein